MCGRQYGIVLSGMTKTKRSGYSSVSFVWGIRVRVGVRVS